MAEYDNGPMQESQVISKINSIEKGLEILSGSLRILTKIEPQSTDVPIAKNEPTELLNRLSHIDSRISEMIRTTVI